MREAARGALRVLVAPGVVVEHLDELVALVLLRDLRDEGVERQRRSFTLQFHIINII